MIVRGSLLGAIDHSHVKYFQNAKGGAVLGDAPVVKSWSYDTLLCGADDGNTQPWLGGIGAAQTAMNALDSVIVGGMYRVGPTDPFQLHL